MSFDEPLTPERLAAEVCQRVEQSGEPVEAIWYAVSGDRQKYCEEVSGALADQPAVAFVVRDARFDNPNAVVDDLIAVVAANQNLITNLCTRQPHLERVVLVLLSRTTLQVPQISSPGRFPDWFPLVGGQEIIVRITDVTWVSAVALNAEEAAIPDLCRALFSLEGVILGRIADTLARDPDAVSSLTSRVKGDEKRSAREWVDIALEAHGSIRNAEAFRPSAGAGRSLMSQLWRAAQESSPETLGRLAKALAKALALRGTIQRPPESISSVLRRPTNVVDDDGWKLCFDMLATSAAGCQLTTAAAHADEYPTFPVPLMRSLSFDLRRSLRDIEEVLAQLS